MLFSSPVFILAFLPATLAGFYTLGRIAGPRAARLWLIGASLVFYGWWNPLHVLLLAGSILANFALARRIRTAPPAAARVWLALGIALDLGLLGWFKYAGLLARTAGLPDPGILLPLAISFFTFQQVMFLADSRAPDAPAPDLETYAAFVCFFPHLIAGPLVRPGEILPQLAAPALARPRAENIARGATIFLLGLAKKLVLADSFATFADPGFAAAAAGLHPSFFEAWYATLAYALQIYFDFSGYSDMAIGLALMLNIRFPINFNSPYKSCNISEFWRRWHITLSQFLRDYLYIPLGGSRRGQARRAFNLMIVMLLGGLWHGAAWTFMLWGGLHGLYLLIHAATPQRLRALLPAALAQALTLLAVLIAWVPFRAVDWAATRDMLRGLAGLNGVALPQLIVSLAPALRWIATPVPVLAHLGDARTLAFPEASLCLALGWAIALFAPPVHELTERQRLWAVTGGFAFTVQALFFAPAAVPFLYFRF
jgi:D-alanyl-lipoteichoic acid acyltransferase DltB (MBOAT superfamily)